MLDSAVAAAANPQHVPYGFCTFTGVTKEESAFPSPSVSTCRRSKEDGYCFASFFKLFSDFPFSKENVSVWAEVFVVDSANDAVVDMVTSISALRIITHAFFIVTSISQ
jgi:hypothetical protein